MTNIRVNATAAYDVKIGTGILQDCGAQVAALGKKYDQIAIISDDIVAGLYGKTVRESFLAQGYSVSEFAFPHGESSKNLQNLEAILGFLCDAACTRASLLVALGGGVVGDITGFAAAVYARGMDYIQIPTTFLAAIDSSVGGKTAVNIPQGKNLAGAFWQPKLVFCDVDTLSTLSLEIFVDGIAEAVKYGCIWDKDLFAQMRDFGFFSALEQIVARCVAIKAEVVSQDERDTGKRALLNFGHTLGHGIEKISKFEISHGKAVAMGMVLAAAAGENNGFTAAGTTAAIEGILRQNGIETQCPYPIGQVCAAASGDKKRSGNEIGVILLKEIGQAFIKPVAINDMAAFFARR